MPTLSRNPKKARKPRPDSSSADLLAGASSPTQAARTATAIPSRPVHRGRSPVVRVFAETTGVATPHPRKLPAELSTRAEAASVSAVTAIASLPAASAAT